MERDALYIEQGHLRQHGRTESLSFSELLNGKQIGVEATGETAPKIAAASETLLAGIDLPGKLTGGRSFLQDLQIPNLQHGRIVRGPSIHHRPTHVRTLDHSLGVVTIHDRDFIGVVGRN